MDDNMNTEKMNRGAGFLSKVPEVTVYFWIIKVLCTTAGETASDFLNVSLGFGLTGTTLVMGAVLTVSLFFQIKAKQYVPALYWLAVVLISIFGTLFTDNLTDKLGVPLEVSTLVFSVALMATFAVWYWSERTLSIHSIYTLRRESFYWLAILFTFALGTAAGDLMAEGLGLGYFVTGLLIAGMSAVITIAWRLGLNAILAFWMAYILTRPLGASLGDFLSQSQSNGGLGLGPAATSTLFVVAILITVIFLTYTKKEQITDPFLADKAMPSQRTAPWQVVLALSAFLITVSAGYYWRHAELQHQSIAPSSAISPLGDLSELRKISVATLNLVQKGDLAAATEHVRDLETAWDQGQSRLKPMNPAKWSVVDASIDHVLRQLRSQRPDAQQCKAALNSLITTLNSLDHPK